MKAIFYFVAIPLLFLSFSCSERTTFSSGEEIKEKKALTGVTRLQVDGVFNLTISQSDEESIEVEGDEAMVNKLLIDQEGEFLSLKMEENIEDGFFDDKNLKIYISIKDLKEIDYEGVGNVKTMGLFKVAGLKLVGNGVGNLELELDAQEIDADFDMVGNIKLRGKASRAIFINNGIGNLDASELIVQNIDVNSSGIGNVEVNCVGDLSLVVNGIGKVSYTGNPRVIKKEVSGIGKVEEN
jgi:hypothetical protein